ncbi:hypothetical protein DL96DRAFT_1614363 [Flagelloscypha sp. PMI_526]|nr:hypothetical protein DL96DRAFT_1614363 [Flagelloscypha sp. PMI_526]
MTAQELRVPLMESKDAPSTSSLNRSMPDISSKLHEGSDAISEVFRVTRWHILSLLFHAFLVVLHLILLILMVLRVERRVHIPLGEQTSRWSTAIQFILQAFALVTLAGSLFVSQKLFLQRLLASRQTLTSSHDQYASWLGLGGALSSLWKQRSVRAGLHPVLILVVIALYLVASTVLKITTAALIQLRPTPTVGSFSTLATGVSPLKDELDPLRARLQPLLMDLIMAEQDPSGNGTKFDSLFPAKGLNGSTIYDVIPVVANATGQMEVNSCTVQVKCFSVDRAVAQGDLFGAMTMSISELSAYESTDNIWGLIRNDTTEQASPYNRTTLIPLLSFLNITDSNGKHSNQIPVGNMSFGLVGKVDEMQIASASSSFGDDVKPTTCNTSRIQDTDLGLWGVAPALEFAVCSIDYSFKKVSIYAESRTLVDTITRKNTSQWNQFDFKDISAWSLEPNLVRIGSESFASQSGMHPSLSCNVAQNSQLADEGFTFGTANPVTFFQKYMAQKMGLISAGVPDASDTNTPYPTFALHTLENALEDFFALNLFSMQQANVNNTAAGVLADNQVRVNVPINTLISELTLNPLPVYLGFGMSLLMLGATIFFALSTPFHVSRVENIGLLQLLYISDVIRTPETSKPTEEDLRRAGLGTNVKLNDGLGELRQRR